MRNLDHEGVDFEWYKNDDKLSQPNLPNFSKKFVILRDSNMICFDSGEGRIQVSTWELTEDTITFSKLCSLRDHQVVEVIDTDLMIVQDFQIGSTLKLFDIGENRLQIMKDEYKNITEKGYRFRTFASRNLALALTDHQ